MKSFLKIGLGGLFSLSLCFASAQDFAKGIVYEDINQNGKRDSKEKVIANVAVSNGVDVVQTNSKGEYLLPIGNNTILFVIKPSEYNLPVNSNNLPQFYYIHKPAGSPKLKYKGIEATGKLPKSVDFGLIPANQTDEFKMLVFGDPQVYNEKDVTYFREGVIKELKNAQGYVFGISLGDLVGNNPNLFEPYIESVKEVGLPWFQVMGNHDINFDVASDSLSDVSFKAHFGPNNYSFNQGKVHFIVLDNVIYNGEGAKKPYVGGLRKDQLQFIENDLKLVPKDYLIVLSMHIPMTSMRTADRNRVYSALKDFPYTFSMSAHTHKQKQIFIDKSQGWQQEVAHHHFNVGTTSGNWYSGELDANGIPPATMSDGTPKGYAVVTFKGNTYMTDYFVSNADKGFKMTVFLPKVIQKKKSSNSSMYVNYFLGSEKDDVEYSVKEGEWKKMERTETLDPTLLQEVLRWDTSAALLNGRRPDDPSPSPHIWRAAVPSNLPVGEHTIRFRVKDMYGRTFDTERTYRIDQPKN